MHRLQLLAVAKRSCSVCRAANFSPTYNEHCTILSKHSFSGRVVGAASIFSACAMFALPAHANAPGRGRTAEFERNHFAFIMNHHFSALRITELAASTDPQCDAAITNPPEGTAPTPNTSSTPAKASSDEIRSMARMANRMQREEINKAQRMLRDWYGVSHTPQLTQEGQQKIQALTQAPAGNPFDRAFLENFSNQRYRALMSSLNCQVKSDLNHDKLKHYCKGIVESKKRALCTFYV